jgi:antitoxin ParD1/3/4
MIKEAIVPGIERLTITLPADMAGIVRGAVEEGGYASTSEVVREALREWKMKRELQLRRFDALKAEIDRGMLDVTEGRLTDLAPGSIIALGKRLSADRARSASPKRRK